MKNGLKKRGLIPLFIVTIIIMVLMILFFVTFGSVYVSPSDVFSTLLGTQKDESIKSIILDLRLPRIIGSFLIGAILAIAGNTFQLVIQNPLADPFLIGVSSGGSFGAVLFMALTQMWGITVPFGIETFSFVFSLISTVLVFMIAKEGKKIPILSLVLSGVIVSFLFNSITTLLTVLYWRNLVHVNLWLMGHTADVTWGDNILLAGALILQLVVIIINSKKLNVISMGEEMAIYSGVNPEKIKILLFFVNIIAVSITVSKAGIIGFVGLIIPHIVRIFVGPYAITSTMLGVLIGGVFLASSDFVSRTIFAPTELPIGVVTSLIGAPVFIYVMKKRGKKL